MAENELKETGGMYEAAVEAATAKLANDSASMISETVAKCGQAKAANLQNDNDNQRTVILQNDAGQTTTDPRSNESEEADAAQVKQSQAEKELHSLKIAVVGAGAVGGTMAAKLTNGGFDVELVCKHEVIAEKARTAGIKINGLENLTVQVKAVAKPNQLGGLKDIIILATKAYDLAGAAKSMLAYAHSKTLFVSVQSGLSTQILSPIVGEARTAACIVGFSAAMNGPADITVTESGYLLLGGLTHHEKIVDHCGIVLKSVCATYISDMIFSEQMSKLIIDASVSSLSAICGLPPAEMLKNKKAQKLFFGLVREAISVTDKMDIYIPSYIEKIDYHCLVRRTMGCFKQTIQTLSEHFKNRKPPDAQSLQRGERAEADFSNGYIIMLAEQAGVNAPLNRALLELVKKIENREIPVSPTNLKSPLFGKK